MSTITTEIAKGKWSSRGSLPYIPVNNVLDGTQYNSFGLEVNHPLAGETRRPYRIETAGSVTYISYDDDSKTDVCIFRVTEG